MGGVSRLMGKYREHECHLRIGSAVVEANEYQKVRMVEKIRKTLGDLNGKTIGILGLSFKPNTDDMREAQSVTIIRSLQAEGAKIKASDPAAGGKERQIL